MGGNSNSSPEDQEDNTEVQNKTEPLKLKTGDVVSRPIESINSSSSPTKGSTWGGHLGVMQDSKTVISKYYDQNGASLQKKESISDWGPVNVIGRGGKKCADHSTQRFNQGAIIDEKHKDTERRDIYDYNLISANCQHYANDCLIQQNGKGKSDDIRKAGFGLFGSAIVSSAVAARSIGSSPVNLV